MLFVPEAKPRDTNHTVGIIAIWYFDKEHILIAQSVAEACYLEIKHIFILQNVQKVSNKQIMPEVIILGCIYALPANRDLMRAEGPNHIPIF